MTAKMSDTPVTNQPVGSLEQLRADLACFSNPAQFDQDDPRLRMILHGLRARIDAMTVARRQLFQDDDYDKYVSILRSYLSDEDEVREILRGNREQRFRGR